MRRRSAFLISALALCACGSDQFSSSNDDGGQVGPGSGDGGDAEAGPLALTPAHAPPALTFVDQDPTVLKVQGTVNISKAIDESDVTGYVLYWSSDGTTKLGAAITTVAKAGGDLTYAFNANTAAPPNANSLLAFTTNDHGENPSPASSAGDNFARFNDVSALTAFPTFSGTFVPIFYEDSAKKFGFMAGSDAFLCPIGTGACTQTATSVPSGGLSVFDSVGKKIIGFTSSASGSALVICNADGTGCTNSALDASLTSVSLAALDIDAAGGKLYVWARSSSSTVTVCNHDGTGCAIHQVSDNGGTTGNFQYPSLAIDSVNSRLVAGVTEFANAMTTPSLVLCPLVFDGVKICLDKPVSTVADSGYNPSVVVDKAGAKILVVADYKVGGAFTSALYRCDLTGDNCSARIDLSAAAGLGNGSGESPSAAIDEAGGHLYVASYDPGANVERLLRCNTDGTGCTATPLVSSVGAGGPMTISLDPGSGKIFFACYTGNGPVFGSISIW